MNIALNGGLKKIANELGYNNFDLRYYSRESGLRAERIILFLFFSGNIMFAANPRT